MIAYFPMTAIDFAPGPSMRNVGPVIERAPPGTERHQLADFLWLPIPPVSFSTVLKIVVT
jgi:hypothetical protein